MGKLHAMRDRAKTELAGRQALAGRSGVAWLGFTFSSVGPVCPWVGAHAWFVCSVLACLPKICLFTACLARR